MLTTLQNIPTIVLISKQRDTCTGVEKQSGIGGGEKREEGEKRGSKEEGRRKRKNDDSKQEKTYRSPLLPPMLVVNCTAVVQGTNTSVTSLQQSLSAGMGIRTK